jgi:hypothetical protein
MEPNRDTVTNGALPNENNASTNQNNNRSVSDDSLQTPDLDGLHFPSIMHIMLRSVGEHHNHEQQEHIVSWQPHGRCFIVHRVHDFERLFLNR